MDRRKALAAAGAVSLTAAAAAAAVGANFGLFGLTGPSGGVGKLSPVVATQLDKGAHASPTVTKSPEVQTIYVDGAETSPATASPGEGASRESAPETSESIEPPRPSEAGEDKPGATPSLTSTTTVRHDDPAEDPAHEHEPDD